MCRRLYLHFLDAYHLHRARRNAHSQKHIVEEARRAFRIALCVADHLYLPASSFYESELARRILATHPMSVATGRVRLTAGDGSLEEHREGKLAQYRPDSPLELGTAYTRLIRSSAGYERREGSTRRHLEYRWLERLHRDDLLKDVDPYGELTLTRRFERAWEQLPAALGNLAFVPGHADDLLSKLWRLDTMPVRSYITKLIESSYVEMYMLGLDAGVVRDLVRLQSPFPLPTHPDSVWYGQCLELLYRSGELPALDAPDEQQFSMHIDRLTSILSADPGGATKTTITTTESDYHPRTAILTILEEEFRAVLLQLQDAQVRVIPFDAHAYVCGRLPCLIGVNGGRADIVLVKQLRMTNTSAATTATSLLKAFPAVRDIIVAGIGGAIPRPESPDKNVALGDVVVSDRIGIWHTDHVSVTEGGRVARGGLPPPSPRLLGALDRWSASENIEDSLVRGLTALASKDVRFARPSSETDVLVSPSGETVRQGGVGSTPRLFRGVIASGNALVRDAYERDRMGRNSGALALDMEGAGVADAVWSASRQYLVVRGLSDYCDKLKNDHWHWYAAASAACAAVSIVAYLAEQ